MFRAVVLFGLLAIATSLRAEPSLKTIYPSGCQVGKSVEVTVAGGGFDKLLGLHFDREGISAELLEKNRFRISVDNKTHVGWVNVWAVTENAIAGPRRFQIDAAFPDRAAIAESETSLLSSMSIEKEPNDNKQQAQEILLGSTCDAKFEKAADVDWFRFVGERDQSLTIACSSFSLDGIVEPMLKLVDPAGQEILFSDARQREPVLHCKLPQSGEYRLKVIDRAYRSGDFAHYRLHVHSNERLLAAYPHVIEKSAALTVKAFGYWQQDVSATEKDWNIELAGKDVFPTSLKANSFGWKGMHFSTENVLGEAMFSLSSLPVVLEIEPQNNQPKTAQPLELPAHVAGRFLERGDLDWYRISAKKNESLNIRAIGERLGQRMDLDVSIHDNGGKLLLAIGDLASPKGAPAELGLGSLDAEALWKAPADGEYLIAVRDLYVGGLFGATRRYELIVEHAKPTFHVFAAADFKKPSLGLAIAPGAAQTIDLAIIRSADFKAAVKVIAVDAPDGINIQPTTLETKETSKTVNVEFADKTTSGIHVIRLVAEAQIGSDKVSIPVECVDILHNSIVRTARGITLYIPKQAVKDEPAKK